MVYHGYSIVLKRKRSRGKRAEDERRKVRVGTTMGDSEGHR